MGKSKPQESSTQALVKQIFRKNLSEAKSAQKEKNFDIQVAFDMVEPYYSRRQKAVVRLMPEVVQRYKAKYSEKTIKEGFAKISSLPVISYEDLEIHSYILLGAAIWILDKLKQHGKLNLACKILPPAAEELNMPNMYDSVHSFDMIASMLTVLQERYGKSDRVIVPKASSRNKDDVFHQILDLIPSEDRDHAIAQFKERFWAWADLYFDTANYFVGESAKLNKVLDECSQQAKEIMQKHPIKEKKQKFAPFAPLNVTAVSPQNISTYSARIQEGSTSIDHVSRMDALISKMQDTDDAITKLSERYSDFQFFACRCSMVGRGILEGAIGKEASDQYYNFPIEDPYAICFALLYLFDLDDDYIWTYGIATGIVCRAGTMLPWGHDEYGDKADKLLHDDEGAYIPSGALTSSWYDMDYKGKKMFEEDGISSANLAQIIYEYCGGVLPRNMERYDGLQKALRKKGLKPSQVSTACALMAVLAESSCQSEISFPSENSSTESASSIETNDSEEPDFDASALAAENDRLRKELSKLRESSKKEVYAANKKVAELNEQLDRANDIIEENSQELADLRDIVFNFQMEPNTPEPPVKMTFPQHTSRRIVAFGGHDSWLREIKPKLPDVRFYGEKVTSPDIIRKADIVWIQTNCIGHRTYYHIIDLCRKHNRRVRYFGYASAAKCAEQVVGEERHNINKNQENGNANKFKNHL